MQKKKNYISNEISFRLIEPGSFVELYFINLDASQKKKTSHYQINRKKNDTVKVLSAQTHILTYLQFLMFKKTLM